LQLKREQKLDDISHPKSTLYWRHTTCHTMLCQTSQT
jgi:hypothetical protein